jgi:6-pyruvoyl-tetrahydropterin synthase
MSYTCKKTYKFEYAHQLFTSFTKLCHETIHGHSGKVEIEFKRVDGHVNKDDMVIDFGEISAHIKSYIMDNYDHALFMPISFPSDYIEKLKMYNKRLTITQVNPTAEYFAYKIYMDVSKILKDLDLGVDVIRVSFWETETGCATYY